MNPDKKTGGPIQELRRTISKEGVRGLWKGVGPAMVRAAALTASQLATYDESKQVKLWPHFLYIKLVFLGCLKA